MRKTWIEPVIETKQAAVGHYFCEGGQCKACHEEAVESPVIGFPTEGVFVKRDSFGRHVIDNTTVFFSNPGQPFEIDHPAAIPDHTWFISLDDLVFADAWRQFGLEDDYLEGGPFQRMVISLGARDWLKAGSFYRSVREAQDSLALQEHIFALLQWMLPLALDEGTRQEMDLSRPANRVAQAQMYLAENFRDKVQLSDLVEATHTSPFHLCRIYREETGHTLHEQLVRLRLRAALEVLKETEPSITSIAHDLGFNSHSHFTSSFQRNFRMTPSFYRQQFA